MARKLDQWAGATDDTRAPPRVRQRIFDDCGGKCHICGVVIVGKRWALDHVKALINGGENVEANLKPVHITCHAEKTAADVKEKAKVAAIRGKHLRVVESTGKIKGPPLPTSRKRADRKQAAQAKPTLAPRQMFKQSEAPR